MYVDYSNGVVLASINMQVLSCADKYAGIEVKVKTLAPWCVEYMKKECFL
jgi:hypothetical protein